MEATDIDPGYKKAVLLAFRLVMVSAVVWCKSEQVVDKLS